MSMKSPMEKLLVKEKSKNILGTVYAKVKFTLVPLKEKYKVKFTRVSKKKLKITWWCQLYIPKNRNDLYK